MSYDYNGYVAALSTMLVVPPDDVNFQVMLPNFIDAAELGIYREVELLDAFEFNFNATLAANFRRAHIPLPGEGTFVIIKQVRVYPIGDDSNPITLTPVSLDFLQQAFGSKISTALDAMPRFFAMFTSQQIICAPPPGQPITIEVWGTLRPTPLSPDNPTTVLTKFFPDLFLAASMVFGAAYLKNFSAVADDPRSGLTWQAQYDRIMRSAQIEEFKKRFASSAWTSEPTSPLAQPPRN